MTRYLKSIIKNRIPVSCDSSLNAPKVASYKLIITRYLNETSLQIF